MIALALLLLVAAVLWWLPFAAIGIVIRRAVEWMNKHKPP